MNLPYKPIHSKTWLERFLSKNYFKKKYDRYMWWRSYTLRNKPMMDISPLRKRIENGNFDLGPYQFEIELAMHKINEKFLEHKHEDTFIEATQIDKEELKDYRKIEIKMKKKS